MRSEVTPVAMISLFSKSIVLMDLVDLKRNAGMLRFNVGLGLERVLEPPQLTWGPLKKMMLVVDLGDLKINFGMLRFNVVLEVE